jgi:hypothetical protein
MDDAGKHFTGDSESVSLSLFSLEGGSDLNALVVFLTGFSIIISACIFGRKNTIILEKRKQKTVV